MSLYVFLQFRRAASSPESWLNNSGSVVRFESEQRKRAALETPSVREESKMRPRSSKIEDEVDLQVAVRSRRSGSFCMRKEPRIPKRHVRERELSFIIETVYIRMRTKKCYTLMMLDDDSPPPRPRQKMPDKHKKGPSLCRPLLA